MTPPRKETVREAATDVAAELRLQAKSDKWGTQAAVSSWLLILAERLEEDALRQSEKR